MRLLQALEVIQGEGLLDVLCSVRLTDKNVMTFFSETLIMRS